MDSFLSLRASGFLLGALALVAGAQSIGPTAGGVFDGQYIQPNASNSALEWWYTQAVAEPVGNNPPATVQIVFYQSQLFQFGPPDPSLPLYSVGINGLFPNGTRFAEQLPASFGNVTASGQEVTGKWGDVAHFKGSSDLSTFTVTVSSAHLGVEGTLKLKSNAPYHFGCNTTTDPYFTSNLSLGWANAIPGGQAEVDITIHGSKLHFTGFGYHDANWAAERLNTIVASWYWGSAQVGPYVLSFWSLMPANSTQIITAGFLSRNGVILQNQCNVNGRKGKDLSIVAPYGLEHDATSGVDVPTGFTIDYILKNGEHFKFDVASSHGAQSVDGPIYHRWAGTASGGKLGEISSKGLTLFEWMNPGSVLYTPTPKY